MAKETKENILKKLSITVIGYEDGDILLLSEMLDEIILLKTYYKKDVGTTKMLDKISEIMQGILQGGEDEDFVDYISDAIDLISKPTGGTSKKSKSEEVKNFLEEDYKKKDPKETYNIDPDYELDTETMKVFLVEAEERMIQGQEIILDLENDMENRKIIDDLFRIFHTIKGECGFLNLIKLGEITHNLENLLDMLRYSEIENNIDIIDIILSGVDTINELLSALKNIDHDEYNTIDIFDIVDKIERCTSNVRVPLGKVLQDEGLLNKKQVEKISKEQIKSGYKKKFGEIATEQSILKEEDIKKTLKKQRAIQIKSDAYVKVSVKQVNYLVDMIGELIIAENQIKDDDIEFLHKITKEVQQTAMMLRTVKIKNLFINMKRVVRDASKKLGKKINLELEGEDLEVDRNLVEHLEEPLIHLLRNSVGHGIEDIETRISNGKSETGVILLKAERVGNQIKITVRDDGAGLNTEKILNKAIKNELITTEKSKNMQENEIFSLIFSPGFSTMEVVDKVSGRGVGMDIVKNTVNSLRGNIGIKSEIGKYSSFTLEFPLIMAIIDSMIILVDGVNFILPVVNIIETLKYDSDYVHNIENKDSVISLRNEIIPVIDLRNFFDMNESDRNEIELAIIVEHNKRKYAFIVDQIVTKKEVVIKSLGDKLKKVCGISAATILSGGVIGYIINVDEVVTGRSHTKIRLAANKE